jgi:IS30 family transposase
MTGLRLTAEQRRMIRRLSAEGLSLRQVARQVSCLREGVNFVLRGHQSRYTRPAWEPAQGRLSVSERERRSACGSTEGRRSAPSRLVSVGGSRR